jgi:hypothetical protein
MYDAMYSKSISLAEVNQKLSIFGGVVELSIALDHVAARF